MTNSRRRRRRSSATRTSPGGAAQAAPFLWSPGPRRPDLVQILAATPTPLTMSLRFFPAPVRAIGPIALASLWFAASPLRVLADSTPSLDALARLSAPGIPALGPSETPVDPPSWTVDPALASASLPGRGAAQHPMLYLGEGCNTLFVVKDGKVVWTYSTGKGWEYDDAWILSNGNVLFSRMAYAAEVTPDKKVVWRMDSPPGTEIHAVQPIGLDRVLLVENGLPPKLMIVNISTGATEVQ